MIRVLDSADSTLVEWGRQQQQHDCDGCDGDDADSDGHDGDACDIDGGGHHDGDVFPLCGGHDDDDANNFFYYKKL